MSLFPAKRQGAARLRTLLEAEPILQVPGCYDALSARVLEAAGFQAAFLGGFSVAASRLGLPDMGLMSYGEMIDQARNVCSATSLPVIGDADTGYGNAINAERALLGCEQAGLACMMIEDQQWPKRCGHTMGKEIVDREEALLRVKSCVRAREERGVDLLIMARTDACATDGFEEALWRAQAFADAGADITFLEAPQNRQQMKRYCETVSGWKTANLVEDGRTPWLTPSETAELGFSIVIYPVSLLLTGLHALQGAAAQLASAGSVEGPRLAFDEARSFLGWSSYEERLQSLADPMHTQTPTQTPSPTSKPNTGGSSE